MTNIFDYLLWRGDLPLSQTPFNQVDGAVLARLSYLPFEHVMEQESGTPVRVDTTCRALLAWPNIQAIVLRKEDYRLLEALQDSPRFQNMEIFEYVNRVDPQTQTQFSAITLRLGNGELFISFRGTDNTLVGWKEDFNMGFECPVPAQQLAVAYFTRVAAENPGSFRLGGHSKGGNLAVYAAAFAPVYAQSRIEQVYNYDGPGFADTVLLAPGYRHICQRVSTYVPQSSVVGMLLGHKEQHTIVHSDQVGIKQHDIYSWEIRRDTFVYLQSVTNSSRLVDYTLKAFVAALTPEQREQFIDAVYAVLSETNASTIREMKKNWAVSAGRALRSMKNLDEPTRKAVMHALKVLGSSTRSGLTRVIAERPQKEKRTGYTVRVGRIKTFPSGLYPRGRK